MPDSTKTQQPTVEQMNQVLEGLPKPPSLEERMSATYNSAAAPQAASPVSTGADAKDAASGNYVANKEIEPTEVLFDDGRIVCAVGGYLTVGRK
jgi:hypothetical protein